MMLLKENPINSPSIPPTDPTRSIESVKRNSLQFKKVVSKNILSCPILILLQMVGGQGLHYKHDSTTLKTRHKKLQPNQ